MAVGALLGLTSCPRSQQQPESVYGPPPGGDIDSIQVRRLVYGPPPVFRRDTIEVVEDVYGPPVEMDTADAEDNLVENIDD